MSLKVESENTKFLRFEYYKQIATATFVQDIFYNVKTAKNRQKIAKKTYFY